MSASPVSKFTAAQQEAIRAEGNVLVSAGAGTGKTRTLVERCLRLIEDGISVKNLLLVTFTEAAAAEMKVRLRAALTEASLRSRTEHHAEQLALLESASIGTLHSFCLQLIRDHFHELALDPQIVVLDESQTLPLMEEALDGLIDPLLSGKGTASISIAQLLRQFSGDPLSQLRRLILQLHRYAQTLPEPAGWYRRQAAAFSDPDAAEWRRGLQEGLVGWALEWLPHLARFRGNINVADCLPPLETLARGGASPQSVQEAIRALWVADQEKPWPRGSKGAVRDHLLPFFDDVTFLNGLLAPVSDGASTAWEADWEMVRPAMATLVFLAQGFGEAFARSKRELGGVDFADLEQLTLRLLVAADGQPTPVAREYRERFSHVFVDEVQDVNSAQDAILKAVSREDGRGNRFLVGDTKQSIYRFRLANPAIFRRYQEIWGGPASSGVVIPLSDNFRSCEGVIAGVNTLFAGLMLEGVGGVAYDEAARLRFGSPELRSALAHNPDVPSLELRVLLSDAVAPSVETAASLLPLDEERASTETEARWIALRLARLRSELTPVWDDGLSAFRPVRWADMVILLRAPGGKVEIYAKEFHKAGVPLLAARGGFFESQEVLDILSLLHILDNPLQDLPLLAVLRSPLGGFSVDELSLLRGLERRDRFWGCLLKAASTPSSPPIEKDPSFEPVLQKARAFVKGYQEWRSALRLVSLSACLEAILAETRYETLLQALPRGEARIGNVRRLLDMARQFDPYQRQGLFRFLRFVEAQEAADLDPGDSIAASQDAVRLLSVHKSKGLEFPVVVAADLGKRWNRGDLSGDVLLDETLGLCPRVWQASSGQRYPSVAHWLARRRAQRESLGEEIRLLYVAATRARDRLILVGTGRATKWVPDSEEEGVLAGQGAALWEVAGAGSALDWIRLFWLRELRGIRSGDEMEGRSALCHWRLGAASALELTSASGAQGIEMEALSISSPVVDLAIEIEPLLRRVEWVYPRLAAAREPAKATVSVLRRRGQEDGDESVPARWIRDRKATQGGVGSAGADASLGPRASAAERGSAHHAFLQWVDLSRTESGLDLHNEGQRLLRQGLLDEEAVSLLDFGRLEVFWQSELGVRLRAHRDRVHRELPFTARFRVEELRELGVHGLDSALDGEERVVVQGQIDLAVVLDDQIWLVDFKTDTVGEHEVQRRSEEYRVQIGVYARALQGIYRRPVPNRWLHFLTPGRTVEMS